MIIQDFQGQPIRLPEERWQHIITRKDHAYMVYMRAELDETLQDPDVIRKSDRDPDTVHIYYKWYENTVVGSKWVLVAVRFFDNGDAFVLTAFAPDEMKPGEEIWRKESQ